MPFGPRSAGWSHRHLGRVRGQNNPPDRSRASRVRRLGGETRNIVARVDSRVPGLALRERACEWCWLQRVRVLREAGYRGSGGAALGVEWDGPHWGRYPPLRLHQTRGV